MESQITFWQAAALAVIQGITEFVPVSSSGHLVLARILLGWSGEAGLAFDTVLHAGSLFALLLYFRHDLAAICKSWLALARPRTDSPADMEPAGRRRELWLIAAATAPAVVAGPFLKALVETQSVRNSLVTGSAMILTAALFAVSDFKRMPGRRTMSFTHALVIGCAQVVAFLPGASRSGWTIGAGVLCGHAREAAVRFSFLMAIPVIAGAVLFQLKDIVNMANLAADPLQVAVGFVLSFAVSLGAIHFCVSYFRTHSLRIFAVYMASVGLLAVLFQ